MAHYCGRLATALGDWEAAEGYLEQAARTHERLDAIRWLNRTRLAHAEVLLARDEPGDRDTADELLHVTETAARREGQGGLARTCEELRPVPARRG